MKTLSLYSRPGCHLCELLAEELEPLIAGRAVLERIDISEDAELLQRYGLRIPILAAGNEELCGYPLERSSVEQYLAE